MVKFPRWVTAPGTDEEKAQRRVRYVVLRAALEITEGASVAALADHCGLSRTHIHQAMREGRFAPKLAAEIEKVCGRKVLRREWLVYPLDIEKLIEQ